MVSIVFRKLSFVKSLRLVGHRTFVIGHPIFEHCPIAPRRVIAWRGRRAYHEWPAATSPARTCDETHDAGNDRAPHTLPGRIRGCGRSRARGHDRRRAARPDPDARLR